MILSRKNIKNIRTDAAITMPDERLLSLPEKVLQFGTGVLLRGLPDYFIDRANKQGIFNGRVVVVKSTSTGGVDAFTEQDGLYTVCIRGIESGRKVEENVLNSAISRVLSANDHWDEVLKCAANPDMQVVISNTTEVGIALINDDLHASPPASFPGKLLSFLYQRYKLFDGSTEKGMVIIPTELIIDNGNKLKNIILELAAQNSLDDPFIDWLVNCNYFCNSLVDRIVPGKLLPTEQKKLEKELGYEDNLMIMSEVYRLWAIESSELKVHDILCFSQVDEGVVIADDISTFRELKLRLLNGSHTFSCALAHFCGFLTVKEAMNNCHFTSYISELMVQEIAPSILNDKISINMAKDFANKVIDRYRNPHIEHPWLSISVQYSSKMRMRNIPVIKQHYLQFGSTPRLMALGFAAFLLFMKTTKDDNGKFVAHTNGNSYTVTDDNASWFAQKWQQADIGTFVKEVLSDERFWDTDLWMLPGFSDAVTDMIYSISNNGALASVESVLSLKTAR